MCCRSVLRCHDLITGVTIPRLDDRQRQETFERWTLPDPKRTATTLLGSRVPLEPTIRKKFRESRNRAKVPPTTPVHEQPKEHPDRIHQHRRARTKHLCAQRHMATELAKRRKVTPPS